MTREAVDHEAWLAEPREPIAATDKYRSIELRYVNGWRWEDTPLFTNIYARRFESEDAVRGCETIEALQAQYYRRVDALFADMRAHGFRQEVNGRETAPIRVYVAHDGEMLLGNQGNHRIAMAHVLNLERVIVEIVGRHPDSLTQAFDPAPVVVPDLPESAREIPAMTSDAERRCYYRIARACAPHGEIVELGAWLGAATAYLAAAVRDAGAPVKVQVYDRFVWKPASHDAKAGGPLGMSQLDAFRRNLGPLLAHVDVHPGELKALDWRRGPVSLLVCDAPKRIPDISIVLTAFTEAIRPGTLMAWQDFAYFPSYDIPAALMRLGSSVEFVEAVSPGTTAVFRVTTPWTREAVSPAALALKQWTADDVESSWAAWGRRLPEAMRPRFACGAAMFLCDLGAADRAQLAMRTILDTHADHVLPKWQYLLRERASLAARYRPIVEVIQACA